MHVSFLRRLNVSSICFSLENIFSWNVERIMFCTIPGNLFIFVHVKRVIRSYKGISLWLGYAFCPNSLTRPDHWAILDLAQCHSEVYMYDFASSWHPVYCWRLEADVQKRSSVVYCMFRLGLYSLTHFVCLWVNNCSSFVFFWTYVSAIIDVDFHSRHDTSSCS